jgi:hypothetical protein
MERTMKKTMIALLAGLGVATVSNAAFVLVDNFEGQTVGNDPTGWTLTQESNNNQNNDVITNFEIANDPSGATNLVGALSGLDDPDGGGSTGNAYRTLDTISSSSTAATVFFRFYLGNSSQTDGFNHLAGVAKNDDPDAWDAYVSYTGALGTIDHVARDEGNGNVDVGDLSLNTWYNVWMVIDNNGDTTDYYLNTGGDATGMSPVNTTDFANRDTSNNDIDRFLLRMGQAKDETAIMYIDDIYVDTTGQNLTAIPEPGTLALMGLSLAALVLFRRRR